jgi:hypothetical protein
VTTATVPPPEANLTPLTTARLRVTVQRSRFRRRFARRTRLASGQVVYRLGLGRLRLIVEWHLNREAP